MSVADSWGGTTTGDRGRHGTTVVSDGAAVSALIGRSNLFRVLVEHTSDIVTVVAADGAISYQSPSCRRVLGYDPEDLIGTSSFDLIHPDDLAWASSMFADHIAIDGFTAPMRIRLRHKNGSWVWLEAIGNNLLHEPDVAGMVVSSRDISAQVRAEHALQESRQWLETLFELSKVISASHHLDELFDTVHQWIAGTLLCDSITTYCRDLETGLMQLQARFPLNSDDPLIGSELPRNDPFVACIERGETIVLNDADAFPVPNHAARPEASSLMLTPLRVRGRSLGVLVLGRTRAPFGDADAALCSAVAGQMAVAIERAQLDRCRETEAHVMAAIARVGQELISCLDTPALVDRLCRVTTEVLHCDACDTRLWDPAEDAFVLVAEFGMSSEEHEAIRPISIPRSMVPLEARDVWHGRADDIESEPLAALGRQFGISGAMIIPLRRGEQLIGVQCAAFRNRDGRFTSTQVQIARAIGQLAAMALENARLVEELQHASRLKSEFVATMSHELRTPLNVIIGYTDLLIEESFGPLSTEQRQVCRRVERSAEELLELINATLDLGRLESGRLPLDLQDVSVGEIAASIEAETGELCKKPNVAFAWRVAKTLPPIRTDPLKVKVILKNLIANAIKFTPAGEVEVAITPHGSGVEVAVRDTGIGIALDLQSIIFEPFRQGDGSTSRRFGGVGLGLYIVRRLVEVLGGTVSVTSEMGQGSTFYVYLPSSGAL